MGPCIQSNMLRGTQSATLVVTAIVLVSTLAISGVALPTTTSTEQVNSAPVDDIKGPINGTNGTTTFEITDFSAPANTSVGAPVMVSATIENTGNATGMQSVEYRFDGDVVAKRPVTLTPDQTRTVDFMLQTRDLSVGEYTHGVFTANDNVTGAINVTEDDKRPGGNLSRDVASFAETSPLTAQQVDPNSLSGKLRVESAHKANTSADLARNSSSNYTLNLTVTGNATNVTFYLQKQAVAASQNISNVTAYLDGDQFNFSVKQVHGQWLVFVVDHFSTRTVTFASTDGLQARDVDNDLQLEDVNGDGRFDVVDVQALFAAIQSDSIQQESRFNFDQRGGVDIIDVQALYHELQNGS